MEMSEFANKERIQIACSCGEVAYIFIDDFAKPYATPCRKCGKKIYQLTCNKCESGFAFPEDAKALDVSKSGWKCEVCGKPNTFTPKTYSVIKNYRKDEIPEEVWNRSRTLLSYWWFKLIMILLFIVIIFIWIISK